MFGGLMFSPRCCAQMGICSALLVLLVSMGTLIRGRETAHRLSRPFSVTAPLTSADRNVIASDARVLVRVAGS